MLGVVQDLRAPRSLGTPEEAAAYQEHLLAEYVLARLAHGVADGTIRGEVAAVEQFLAHAGVPGHPRLYARVLGPGCGRRRAYRPGALRANCYENCYEGQMSAAWPPAFPLVKHRAACRNRTDDLFITSESLYRLS